MTTEVVTVSLFADLDPPSPDPAALAAKEDKRIRQQRRQEARTRIALMKRLNKRRKRERVLTEYRIKGDVRHRDGYRCRDCGMSREEHIEETGRDLHVHRINAGARYRNADCVTLCKDCHAAKKNHEDEDVFTVGWHLYHKANMETFATLAEEASRLGLSVSQLIGQVLEDHVKKLQIHRVKGADCRA